MALFAKTIEQGHHMLNIFRASPKLAQVSNNHSHNLAYNQGAQAHIKGKPRSDNPHDGELSIFWGNGWDDASFGAKVKA